VTAIPDDVVLDIAITQLHGSRVIGYIYKWFFANVCCCVMVGRTMPTRPCTGQ
jgi:hypothetical protein